MSFAQSLPRLVSARSDGSPEFATPVDVVRWQESYKPLNHLTPMEVLHRGFS